MQVRGPATITVSKNHADHKKIVSVLFSMQVRGPATITVSKKNRASHEKIGHLFWMQLRAEPPVQAMMAILNQCGWIHDIEIVLK